MDFFISVNAKLIRIYSIIIIGFVIAMISLTKEVTHVLLSYDVVMLSLFRRNLIINIDHVFI